MTPKSSAPRDERWEALKTTRETWSKAVQISSRSSDQHRVRDVETTNADYLTGAPDLDTALLQHHLSPVGKPPDNAWDDEKHREEIEREA